MDAPNPSETRGQRRLIDAVRRRGERRRCVAVGGTSVTGYLGQVGVLGWSIVVPALVGLFAGRWLDQRLGSSIFWSAPLMLAGLALGCWSAWRWMHRL
jgi:ATP synthase protein I